MLYRLLRATAAIALRWYYAGIVVQGSERVPLDGPLLILANHPNALIDPLLVGTAVERRVLLTAKATLFDNPALALLLRAVGVVPLRRAKDELRADASDGASSERNAQAFARVTATLRARRVVLIFPEGISHDDPMLAPLKSGAARMAMQARSEGVTGIRLLPLGLVYEAKERPNSHVLVRIGDDVDLDGWAAAHGAMDPRELTDLLEERLRAVTLNFATAARAARAVRLARVFVALAGMPRPVGEPRPLEREVALAQRIDAAITALANAPLHVTDAADALVTDLETVERELQHRGIALADLRVSTRTPDAVSFVAREGPIALFASLALTLGWVTHWVPLRAARAAALRSLSPVESRDQPAMRTVLFGLSAVVLWYVLWFIVVARLASPLAALTALATIFTAAHARRLAKGRLERAVRRARSFLALRADPTLQSRLVARVDAMLDDALALERALVGGDAASVDANR